MHKRRLLLALCATIALVSISAGCDKKDRPRPTLAPVASPAATSEAPSDEFDPRKTGAEAITHNV
ncbi:MAG: hypothetical protein WC712_12495, partial [Candidatus Brocadiia bacterium]